MRSVTIRSEPWERNETGRSTLRRGHLYALRIRWNRMGYPAWLYILALCMVPVLMILPGFMLVVYADKLGVWWAILLFLYFALLAVVYTRIVYPREMAYMRYMLGDEAFFLIYPEEKKREQRRQQREHRRQERRTRR